MGAWGIQHFGFVVISKMIGIKNSISEVTIIRKELPEAFSKQSGVVLITICRVIDAEEYVTPKNVQGLHLHAFIICRESLLNNKLLVISQY